MLHLGVALNHKFADHLIAKKLDDLRILLIQFHFLTKSFTPYKVLYNISGFIVSAIMNYDTDIESQNSTWKIPSETCYNPSQYSQELVYSMRDYY